MILDYQVPEMHVTLDNYVYKMYWYFNKFFTGFLR